MDPALHKWGVQWGRVLGLAGMVVVLNIISMLVTLMVHLFTPKGSVEVSMYVFYFFYLDITGFSFLFGNIHVCGTLD